MSDQKNLNALPPGFEFDGYRVERVLGAGGFGITYRATEVSSGRKVAIKELLPKSYVRRESGDPDVRLITDGDREKFAWCRERFADEAKVLIELGKRKHPNVVHTLRYTEAHGTAYIVMDFVEGGSLGTVLKRAGTLTQSEIEEFLFPLLKWIRDRARRGLPAPRYQAGQRLYQCRQRPAGLA